MRPPAVAATPASRQPFGTANRCSAPFQRKTPWSGEPIVGVTKPAISPSSPRTVGVTASPSMLVTTAASYLGAGVGSRSKRTVRAKSDDTSTVQAAAPEHAPLHPANRVRTAGMGLIEKRPAVAMSTVHDEEHVAFSCLPGIPIETDPAPSPSKASERRKGPCGGGGAGGPGGRVGDPGGGGGPGD